MTLYNKNCHNISVNAFTGAKVQLIAHRGAANYAPENTVPALIKAIEMGADVLEIDIRQLKTGEFVLLHDNLLNRTTNSYGFIANKTLAEIKKIDAGSWFSDEFVGETIPTLEEVLKVIPDSIALLLDFKKGNIKQLLTFLDKQNAYQRKMYFHSNDSKVHEAIRKQGSQLTTIASCYTSFNMFNCIEEKRPHIANFVWERVNMDLVNKAKELGYLVELNTIGLFHTETEEMLMQAIAYQPDFILTNEPAKVKRLLEKLNLR